MNLHKVWLVAWTTFRQAIQNRFFLILTLALPLVFVVSAAVPILAQSRTPEGALGCVDLSGQLTLPADGLSSEIEGDGVLTLVPVADTSVAEAGRQAGSLVGYIVIPEDYMASGRVIYYGETQPTPGLQQALGALLRRALAPEAPDWVLARLSDGSDWLYEDLETGRTLSGDLEVQLWALMPMALGMVFILLLSTTLNSVGPSVVREKEERSMEMILTSLRTEELMGGKLLGITLLSAVQLGIWLAAAAVALAIYWIGEGNGGFPTLRWSLLGWGLLLGVPGYLLYAALAAGLGILAGTREQARQTSGFLSILAVAPLFLLTTLLSAPDSTMAVALTLIPFFAPTVVFFRMMLTEVPAWQLWTAFALLWIAVAAALWVTARVFRMAALLYGQRMDPRHIWRTVFAGSGRRSS